MEPWELIRSLCPDPAFKFVSPSHITITKLFSTWDTALTHLLQGAKLHKRHIKSQSVVLVGRGSSSSLHSLISNIRTIERRVKQACNTVQWNPFPVDVWISKEGFEDTKHMSLLSNSSGVNHYLDVVCCRSRLMYDHRAYWHWYEQCGLERGTFEQAFESLQTVIDCYKQL